MANMSAEEFDSVVEDRVNTAMRTMTSKGLEYAAGHNRLHNFDRASEMLSSTPEAALLGYLAKHLVSLHDMVESVDELHPDGSLCLIDLPYAVWEEKIGDTINYLIWLDALVKSCDREKHPLGCSKPY